MTRSLAALAALVFLLSFARGARGDDRTSAARPQRGPHQEPRVVVGSKAFPESWILGEALRALAKGAGARAEHAKNLGGTEIVLSALRSGAVDAYVEYTGTIDEVILGKRAGRRSALEMERELAALGVGMSAPLGFDDGYALAIAPAAQKRTGATKIGDLASHPELRLGMTHEFLGRSDGFPGLAARYGLAARGESVRGVQHELAFDALASGALDVTDVYTTDPEIARLGLVVLTDDLAFFPRYDAVLLHRLDLPARAPEAFAAMQRIVGRVDQATMMRANAALALDHAPLEDAARIVLPADAPATLLATREPAAHAILRDTAHHAELVLVSLIAAILLGVPLGVVAARARALAAGTMSFASVLQTVPSLALLALLVPVFGIGAGPAIVALFLYGLLPIVRGTFTGLTTIPPELSESADALGLPPWAKLRRVMLPLASPSILAGIKTSAVINVGTATIAALVGAEGLGNPILQGITLRDTSLILRGAIPAAALALTVEGAFTLAERRVVPRGLRLRRQSTSSADG
jgi:osmoprotectant transport system permease protein